MAKSQLVRPIIEFFELQGVDSKRGVNAEIFADVWEGKTYRFLSGVKRELQAARGVYIFYDSRGRAIYAGKAEAQSLWKELNLAYNRDRGDLQTIKRVSHPINDVAYNKVREVRRRITRQQVTLYHLASYVSAYEVRPTSMIAMFEALIVRAFANDLLNKKMETIG